MCITWIGGHHIRAILVGPDSNWIRIQLLCGSGSIFRIHRIEDKNHRNAESENAPAVILFFLILKLTVFQIYFVFFFFLRCFCYCMKKSIKSLRSGTGSNRGKFLVPDPNYMFLIHKTGSNSNLALYLICVQYRIHFRILYQKTVCTVHIS